ncbi:MAG: SpoIIE family protein phosphatase [Bacteroidota bacterium]
MKKNVIIFSLFIFTLCFCKPNLSAQQAEIDSLQNVLKFTKADTNRVKLYCQLFLYTDSLFYLQEGLKLSTKINYTFGTALSFNYIGYHYYSKEKYDISLSYLIKAMKLAETFGYKKMLANVYKFIGFIYRPSDPNIAVEYYSKSLRIFNEMHNEIAASYLLSAIGNVYEGTYGIRQDGNQEHSALDYYLKSLEIRERIGSPGEIASSLNETSRIYERIGNHKKASDLREKGLRLAEKAGSNENIVYLCNLIGQDFLKQQNYEKALLHQLRAYKIVTGEKTTNYLILSEVAQGLATTYTALGDYKNSTEYYRLFITCNDTMRARVSNVNLINLKNTLANEREKQNLFLKDAEIDKQKAIVDKQIVLRNAFVVGFALVIALVIFIFVGYRQKQKTNRELDNNNKKIEFAYKIIKEKTNEITDSIHYALRIQKATLPHRRDIWAELKNSFVLFKPKDIVSGDFYWFSKKGDTIFIAAMDCTGHGVPGAFMSIIGSERLNDAVQNEDNLSKILSLLNIGIKTSLRQSENIESTRDGMDIALCSIDLNTNIINYAGANRPLWIIRKNADAIEEIKATKTAIGGLTESLQYFETHTIQLEKDDSFYLFTDGYADQDGGEKGKKLMTKKFKQILLEIKDLTMQEQEAHLEAHFENWRGKKEQLDDILIIGIRI